MNSDTLKLELKTLQDYVKVTRDFVMEAEKDSDRHKERIAEIEAQIAEEKKPQLKHLDYGIGEDGMPRVILREHDDHFISAGNYCTTKTDMPIATIYGNVNDEIKALREDLDQAEFVEKHGQPSTIKLANAAGGRLQITVLFQGKDLTGYINKDERDAFCKEARQIVATMKRNEAKK